MYTSRSLGPRNSYAFRPAKKILGNSIEVVELECTTAGSVPLFHNDAHIEVVGEPASLSVNNRGFPTAGQSRYWRTKHYDLVFWNLGTLHNLP